MFTYQPWSQPFLVSIQFQLCFLTYFNVLRHVMETTCFLNKIENVFLFPVQVLSIIYIKYSHNISARIFNSQSSPLKLKKKINKTPTDFTFKTEAFSPMLISIHNSRNILLTTFQVVT